MTAMRVLFDTRAYQETLKRSGIPEDQANVHTDALITALFQGVATHEDITDLETKIGTLDAKVDALGDELRGAIKAQGAELCGEIKAQGAGIDRKVLNLYWMVGITLATVALTNPLAMHVMKVLGFVK